MAALHGALAHRAQRWPGAAIAPSTKKPQTFVPLAWFGFSTISNAAYCGIAVWSHAYAQRRTRLLVSVGEGCALLCRSGGAARASEHARACMQPDLKMERARCLTLTNHLTAQIKAARQRRCARLGRKAPARHRCSSA